MTDADRLAEARRRLPAARKAILDATGDMPCSGAGGGSGTSDRTGGIAVRLIDGTDQAWRDLDTLTTIEWANRRNGGITRNQLRDLEGLIDRWAPSDKRRAQLDANHRAAANDLLNRHQDHGNCESCKRVAGAWGEPHRKGLCKTCARWLDRIHVLYDVELGMPPRDLVELGHARGKVTDHDIHNTMHGNKRREQT